MIYNGICDRSQGSSVAGLAFRRLETIAGAPLFHFAGCGISARPHPPSNWRNRPAGPGCRGAQGNLGHGFQKSAGRRFPCDCHGRGAMETTACRLEAGLIDRITAFIISVASGGIPRPGPSRSKTASVGNPPGSISTNSVIILLPVIVANYPTPAKSWRGEIFCPFRLPKPG